MKRVKVDKTQSMDMFTLASFWPSSTGLPVVIWIEERSDTPKDKHGPRIRVMTHPGKINIRKTVTVTLEDPPRLIGHLNTKYFNKVKEFIELNRKALVDYWDHKIDIAEFARGIKKINKNKGGKMVKRKVRKSQDLDMFAMASFWPEDTGLPIGIWMEERSDPPRDKHGPRIRVTTRRGKISVRKTVTVTLEDPPRLIGSLNRKYLEKVKKFIALNRRPLLDHWNLKISTLELARRIKKIDPN